MEKYVNIKSPFTGGRVKEIYTTEEKEFRKEKFTVPVRFYVCEDTGEQFTTTEQDNIQFDDLYKQYRLKHGIPSPDEIREIRNSYGLNYSQISTILGFGANQYAKYESGEVPSESNGKKISALKDKDMFMTMFKKCKKFFQPSEYEKILNLVLKSDNRTPISDEFILSPNQSASIQTIVPPPSHWLLDKRQENVATNSI